MRWARCQLGGNDFGVGGCGGSDSSRHHRPSPTLRLNLAMHNGQNEFVEITGQDRGPLQKDKDTVVVSRVGGGSRTSWPIPVELDALVFGLLPRRELPVMAAVCRRWRESVYPILWRRLVFSTEVSEWKGERRRVDVLRGVAADELFEYGPQLQMSWKRVFANGLECVRTFTKEIIVHREPSSDETSFRNGVTHLRPLLYEKLEIDRVVICLWGSHCGSWGLLRLLAPVEIEVMWGAARAFEEVSSTIEFIGDKRSAYRLRRITFGNVEGHDSSSSDPENDPYERPHKADVIADCELLETVVIKLGEGFTTEGFYNSLTRWCQLLDGPESQRRSLKSDWERVLTVEEAEDVSPTPSSGWEGGGRTADADVLWMGSDNRLPRRSIRGRSRAKEWACLYGGRGIDCVQNGRAALRTGDGTGPEFRSGPAVRQWGSIYHHERRTSYRAFFWRAAYSALSREKGYMMIIRGK